AALRGQQVVIGLLADLLETGDLRGITLAEVGDPDFRGIEQGEQEALAGSVDHPDHARVAAAIGQRGAGDVGNQLQALRIEDLDAARFVVAHGDQPAVLADGAANAVAALDHPLVDALLEQVDLGQPAVAAEHVGVAFVAGKHHRGMRQVAEAFDARQAALPGAFDQLHAAAGAFDDQAEVAGGAGRGAGLADAGTEQQAAGCQGQQAGQQGTLHGLGYPCSRVSTSQAISCSLSRALQAGMAVPGRPWVTVAIRLSRGLWPMASRVSAGPRPPVMRRPWHEPQSWTSRCSSRACCAVDSASAWLEGTSRSDAVTRPRARTALRRACMACSLWLI